MAAGSDSKGLLTAGSVYRRLCGLDLDDPDDRDTFVEQLVAHGLYNPEAAKAIVHLIATL
jgi:hypothetical protein